jgi:hypothetical protein
MTNPYRGLPDHAFWNRAVSGPRPDDVDPVTATPFRIAASDKVATAGSCFAQHISRTLTTEGFQYLVTEPAPVEGGENYGVFPARFGNIYTVAQLLQLFDRAYGLFEPVNQVWRRPDGAWVDPFRPQIVADGFPTIEALVADREVHLAAVQRMFEACDVFIFTLGLTEGWANVADGSVVPLAPGVAAEPEGGAQYRFVNFKTAEMAAEMTAFLERLRTVNPRVRVILTVSPVSLIATYEPRHVLLSTIYSKSALRVVAQMMADAHDFAAYFPSFEIITGHHQRYRFFEPDLRSVTPAGVAHVMSIFSRHFLASGDASAPQPAKRSPIPGKARPQSAKVVAADLADLHQIICDEEILDK